MNTWTTLTAKHGRRCVLSPTITDEEHDACTDYQRAVLRQTITPLLTGTEQKALDYGAGAGRLSPTLEALVPGTVWAYEPCRDLLCLADQQPGSRIIYSTKLPPFAVDLVLCWAVLGGPTLDPQQEAGNIVASAAPGALIVVVDHMPIWPQQGRWWKFRPQSLYVSLFRDLGVTLERVGTCMQLRDELTILAGRLSSS